MKIVNPYYQHPLDIKSQQYKSAVTNWLRNTVGNSEKLTFDDLRAEFPAVTEGMTDGYIQDMLSRMGFSAE